MELMPTRTCEKAGGGEKGREGKGTTEGARYLRNHERSSADLAAAARFSIGRIVGRVLSRVGVASLPPPLPPTLDFQRYLPIFLLLSAPLWRVPLASFIETGSRSRDLASLSNLVFFHHRESCTIFFFFFFFLFTRFFPHTFVSWRACSRGEFLETVFKV